MCMDAGPLAFGIRGNSFDVHAYCLMPDHLHFLAEGTEPTSDLRHFIKSLKIKTSRQ